VSEDPGDGTQRAQPHSATHATPATEGRGRQVLTYRVLGAACALVGVLLVIGGLLALRGRPAAPPVGASAGASFPAGPAPVPPLPSPSATPTATSVPAAPTPPPSPPVLPSTKPAGPASSPAAQPSGAAGQPAARAPLTVLNNTTRRHLAEQVADALRAGGWEVVKVGNFTGRIPATTVYYTPGSAAEERAARHLAAQFPRIRRVLPRYAGLPSSVRGVIVVLAPDW
jgi:hypothetical protein